MKKGMSSERVYRQVSTNYAHVMWLTPIESCSFLNN